MTKWKAKLLAAGLSVMLIVPSNSMIAMAADVSGNDPEEEVITEEPMDEEEAEENLEDELDEDEAELLTLEEGEEELLEAVRDNLFTQDEFDALEEKPTKYAIVSGNTYTIHMTAGSGDITQILQGCINQGKGNASMINIVVPAGSYTVDATLHLYSCMNIKLSANTVIKRVANSTMLCADRENAAGYGGLHDVTIDGGTWDGNKFSSIMFPFAHTKNVTFKNMTIKNVSKHCVELGGVKNFYITNCTFKDLGAKEDETYDTIQIDNLGSKDNMKFGEPYDKSVCDGVYITGCHFENLMDAVGTHDAKYQAKNIQVKDCTFKNMKYYCIRLYGFKDSVVSGCTAENVGSFLQMYKNSATIKNNTILSHTGKREYIMTIEAGSGTTTIEGNTFCGAKNYAIQMRQEKETDKYTVKISGNTFKDGSESDIKSFFSNAKSISVIASGNNFGSTTANTVDVEFAKKATIDQGNIFKKGGAHAVSIKNTSAFDVVGNTINAATKDGIHIEATHGYHVDMVGSVTDNVVKKAKKVGINIYNINNAEVCRNAVSSTSSKKDIVFEDSSGKCKDNVITGKIKTDGGVKVENNAKLLKTKVSIKSAKSSKKGQVKVSWKKVTDAAGYRVTITDATGKSITKTTTKTSLTLKKIAKGKATVTVCAYTKAGKTKYFAPESKVKKVTVK